MEQDQWIEVNLVHQRDCPDRKVYEITTGGREELRRWLAEPTASEQLRSESAVKVRGMQFCDKSAVIDGIKRRREDHRSRLDFYLSDAARNFPEPAALKDRQIGSYLVLRGGILTESAGIAWCDEMLGYLEGCR